MRLCQATPGQQAAIDRLLECGGRTAECGVLGKEEIGKAESRNGLESARGEEQRDNEVKRHEDVEKTQMMEWRDQGTTDYGTTSRSADVAEILAGIHSEIAAVRKDFGELQSAKQRLEQMLADGVFAFTGKVDATSFKVLCTILAEGDVS